MSQEDVEVVRRFHEPYDGADLIPGMRVWVERLGPDFRADAVLAYWAEDPAWQHVHPDIEWDSRVGGLSETAHGAREVALWWADWLEVWETFVARVLQYRDLGDWILVPFDVRARGRGGIAVEIHAFALYQVREGKVAVYRSFLSEQEALDAAGLAG
jgi:hypothetical protein